MTRRKQARLRRKYNAMRRMPKGWTPASWMRVCLSASEYDSPEWAIKNFLRKAYKIA